MEAVSPHVNLFSDLSALLHFDESYSPVNTDSLFPLRPLTVNPLTLSFLRRPEVNEETGQKVSEVYQSPTLEVII